MDKKTLKANLHLMGLYEHKSYAKFYTIPNININKFRLFLHHSDYVILTTLKREEKYSWFENLQDVLEDITATIEQVKRHEIHK